MGPDEQIVEVFRSKGYKATPQRISVARSVLTSREHPSAESVYKEVKRVHPTISLSTVYNTLHVLKELNMVHELGLNCIGLRFDPNTKPHINMVCSRCGMVRDLEDPLFEEALERVEKRTGYKITVQTIELYGLCKRCIREGLKISGREDK
jgi:Fur family peroxide stress response transcriptional regulator